MSLCLHYWCKKQAKMSIFVASLLLLILGGFPYAVFSRPDEMIDPESYREVSALSKDDPSFRQNMAAANWSLEYPVGEEGDLKEQIKWLQNLVRYLQEEVRREKEENLVLHQEIIELQKNCENLPPAATPGSNQVGVTTTAIGCEYNTLKLGCKIGSIHIKSALYGRLRAEVCKDMIARLFPGYTDQPQSITCTGKTSDVDIVKQRCEAKQRCAVMVSSSVFGDPCYNTFKYLQVDYECLS